MKLAAVLTDLDGTLLEPDGTLRPEARDAVLRLVSAGIPVCPVTSKTAAEVEAFLAELGLVSAAGFENGAGVRHADGAVELLPAAVPLAGLREVLDRLRRSTGAPLRSLEELTDGELGRITGLTGDALARARDRHATLPLVVPVRFDGALRRAAAGEPHVRLLRGNRFLHLQGAHDKADAVPRLLGALATGGDVMACGDAPNDLELLAAASVRVIVPGRRGPSATLMRRFPDAVVAPLPHGRGWAAVVTALLSDADQGSVAVRGGERGGPTMANSQRRRPACDG